MARFKTLAALAALLCASPALAFCDLNRDPPPAPGEDCEERSWPMEPSPVEGWSTYGRPAGAEGLADVGSLSFALAAAEDGAVLAEVMATRPTVGDDGVIYALRDASQWFHLRRAGDRLELWLLRDDARGLATADYAETAWTDASLGLDVSYERGVATVRVLADGHEILLAQAFGFGATLPQVRLPDAR